MLKHYVAVGVLIVAITAILWVVTGGAGILLPEQASEEAGFVDRLFDVHFGLVIFIFALIMVFMLYSVVVFRRKPGEEGDGAYIRGNTRLEVLWTVIPLGIVLVLATLSAQYLGQIEKVEADELLIKVTGFQWDWRFEYPDYGISATEINIPLNRQVRFEMTSEDVIHSFWVPEFRVKQDLVPGLTTTVRVKPTQLGQYTLRCAELCGTRHAYMNRPVNVMQTADFETWVAAEQAAVEQLSPVELGAKVAQEQGCLSCHSLDGSALVGPTWQGLFGSQRDFDDGTSAVADEEYLHNSIVNPNSQIVAGFQPNVMRQDYGDTIPEKEINALVEYIKSLEQ
jgi:cytochrome c oxidase subunit 2